MGGPTVDGVLLPRLPLTKDTLELLLSAEMLGMFPVGVPLSNVWDALLMRLNGGVNGDWNLTVDILRGLPTADVSSGICVNGELATCFSSSSVPPIPMEIALLAPPTLEPPVPIPMPMPMPPALLSPPAPMVPALPTQDGLLNMLMGFENGPTGDTGFCAGVMFGDMFAEASGWKAGVRKGDAFGVAEPEDGDDTPDEHCCCCSCNASCCCCC